jgi:phosphoadenosine phosphosulfate reductase
MNFVLIENTLFGSTNKIQIAIERLKEFEPPEGYYLAFSGGKDSMCIYHLAKMAGVKFDNHVGFDPPELIQFIKTNYVDVKIELPKRNQWERMSKIGPASRMARWCCDHKEHAGKGRTVVVGVRAEESAARAMRPVFQQDLKIKTKHILCPIIDWNEGDVWEFIEQLKLPYCSLYDEGFSRLGCIMCPLTSKAQREIEAKRWPKHAQAYLKMCEMAFNYKKQQGKTMPQSWKSGQDMFNWWMEGKAIEEEGTIFNEGR